MVKREDDQADGRIDPLWIGIILSCVVVILALLLIWHGESCNVDGACSEGFGRIALMSPNEVGDMLGGVSGALAFIWIIVAVWLQSLELAAQRRELYYTRLELEGSKRALEDQVRILTEQTEVLVDEARQRQAERTFELLSIAIGEMQKFCQNELTRTIDILDRDGNVLTTRQLVVEKYSKSDDLIQHLRTGLDAIVRSLSELERGAVLFREKDGKTTLKDLDDRLRQIIDGSQGLLPLELSRLKLSGVHDLHNSLQVFLERLGPRTVIERLEKE